MNVVVSIKHNTVTSFSLVSGGPYKPGPSVVSGTFFQMYPKTGRVVTRKPHCSDILQYIATDGVAWSVLSVCVCWPFS